MFRMGLALLALLLASASARAHDMWADGTYVPPWVKSACCGPEDVHHLTADNVHYLATGIMVDGYPDLIPYGKELPSQDGDYWIFYKKNFSGASVSFSGVYCFFAPAKGY